MFTINKQWSEAKNQNLYYTLGETNHISASTNRFATPPETPISYDSAGNIRSDFKFRAQSYSYDANNRLTKTFDADGTGRTSGVYDATGQRVQVTIEGEWRHFVYDALGRVVSEYGPEGRERERIYRGSQMLATEKSTGACRNSGRLPTALQRGASASLAVVSNTGGVRRRSTSNHELCHSNWIINRGQPTASVKDFAQRVRCGASSVINVR